MLLVEDAELVRPEGFAVAAALIIRSVEKVCAVSYDFLFVSLATRRVSRKEVCLHSFDVLNSLLNRLASLLGEVVGLPAKVIDSFSA